MSQSVEEGSKTAAGAAPRVATESNSNNSKEQREVTLAEANPHFTFYKLPIDRQLKRIEKEFEEIESATNNPQMYNFTTSQLNVNKNRYLNVWANEETIYPPISTFYKNNNNNNNNNNNKKKIYINANHIVPFPIPPSSTATTAAAAPTGEHKNEIVNKINHLFIACQAPPLQTIPDFLKLCFEEKIQCIIMLTSLLENDTVKADRYWPREKTNVANDVIRKESTGEYCIYYDTSSAEAVKKNIRELGQLNIVEREFIIEKIVPKRNSSSTNAKQNENESINEENIHRIKQLQYTGWPDHGVPDHTASFEYLLRYIDGYLEKEELEEEKEKGKTEKETGEKEIVKEGTRPQGKTEGGKNPKNINKNKKLPHPILVHCSAGIGRTGTLIGAYSAYYMLHQNKVARDLAAKNSITGNDNNNNDIQNKNNNNNKDALIDFTNESIKNIVLQMRKCRFGMVQRMEQYAFIYLILLKIINDDGLGCKTKNETSSDANPTFDAALFSKMLAERSEQYQIELMEAAARNRRGNLNTTEKKSINNNNNNNNNSSDQKKRPNLTLAPIQTAGHDTNAATDTSKEDKNGNDNNNNDENINNNESKNNNNNNNTNNNNVLSSVEEVKAKKCKKD